MELPLLSKIDSPLLLTVLDSDTIKELQQALLKLGYPVGDADGRIGSRTSTAWSEFKVDVVQGNPTLIGPSSVKALKDQLERHGGSGAYDFSTSQGTIAAIIAECKAQGLTLKSQIAYVLATVKHETANSFKPVREAFYLGEPAATHHRASLSYSPYYGRGYVQLTWKTNYAKYENILGVALVTNPDLALKPDIALFVLVHGFKTGAFTGRKLSDYVNAQKTDFVNARRCINGTDKATLIAGYANHYLANI